MTRQPVAGVSLSLALRSDQSVLHHLISSGFISTRGHSMAEEFPHLIYMTNKQRRKNPEHPGPCKTLNEVFVVRMLRLTPACKPKARRDNEKHSVLRGTNLLSWSAGRQTSGSNSPNWYSEYALSGNCQGSPLVHTIDPPWWLPGLFSNPPLPAQSSILSQKCAYAWFVTLQRSTMWLRWRHPSMMLWCLPGSSIEYKHEVCQGNDMQHHNGQHHGGLAGHVWVRQQVLRSFHACGRHGTVCLCSHIAFACHGKDTPQSDSRADEAGDPALDP